MKTLLSFLDSWVNSQAEKKLFVMVNSKGQDHESLTYGEFAKRCNTLASYLVQTVGIQFGDRVLIAHPNNLEFMLAFFACVKLGAIPVPVKSPSKGKLTQDMEKLMKITQNCDARYALGSRQLLSLLKNEESQAKIEHLSASFVEIISPFWVATDIALHDEIVDFVDTPNDILFLQYTSGSTGDPKGVVVSHSDIIHNESFIDTKLHVTVTWLPTYHDMGLIGTVLFPLINGGTVYMMSPQSFLARPEIWLKTISRVKATHTSAPNFGYKYCLQQNKIDEDKIKGMDLSSLRFMLNGAEPVDSNIISSFVKRFQAYGLSPEALFVAYGLAEATLIVTLYGRRILQLRSSSLSNNLVEPILGLSTQSDVSQLTSCGKIPKGSDIRIVDQDTGLLAENNRVGEVWVSSPCVSRGYWNNPELSKAVFRNSLPDSGAATYLRTGDLGFIFEGELYVCGRLKDLIIIRGVNFYPQDIEAAVEASASEIRQNGVAAFSVQKESEQLVVVAELVKSDIYPDPSKLIRTIIAQLDVEIDVLLFTRKGSISKTTSGKIARGLTKERFFSNSLPVVHQYDKRLVNSNFDLPGVVKTSFPVLVPLVSDGSDLSSTFSEMGISSLELAELNANLEVFLQQWGARELIAQIDIPLLQSLTYTDFLNILNHVQVGKPVDIAACQTQLSRIRKGKLDEVHQQMLADIELEPSLEGSGPLEESVSRVLLTGPTGFLGPFLLRSLLLETSHTLYVLVRARDEEHGKDRIHDAMKHAMIWSENLARKIDERVFIVCGDLRDKKLGMSDLQWSELTESIHAVVHNGALVNYVHDYDKLKPHNVEGTRNILNFSRSGVSKDFHYISTTFIFGWTNKPFVTESECNIDMANLDFGYSQSKWVAEQLVRNAGRGGLNIRIYRPSLISASSDGACDQSDIFVRLISFMINKGIAINSENQLSLAPVDLISNNIVSLIKDSTNPNQCFHVTAERYYNMVDVTKILTRDYRYQFKYLSIADFTKELKKLCTEQDGLYPLMDFFVRATSKLEAMQLKRYDNDEYLSAIRSTPTDRVDPPLEKTISYLMQYLLKEELVLPGPQNLSELTSLK